MRLFHFYSSVDPPPLTRRSRRSGRGIVFLFLGGVPCLECVFLLRSLVLLLLRLGWLALPLSAAVLLGTHSLGGCWLSSSVRVLLLAGQTHLILLDKFQLICIKGEVGDRGS